MVGFSVIRSVFGSRAVYLGQVNIKGISENVSGPKTKTNGEKYPETRKKSVKFGQAEFLIPSSKWEKWDYTWTFAANYLPEEVGDNYVE